MCLWPRVICGKTKWDHRSQNQTSCLNLGLCPVINSDWAQNQLAKLRGRGLGYLGKRRKECQETQVLQINPPGARAVESCKRLQLMAIKLVCKEMYEVVTRKIQERACFDRRTPLGIRALPLPFKNNLRSGARVA